jgi:hypothetical protein
MKMEKQTASGKDKERKRKKRKKPGRTDRTEEQGRNKT